MNYFILFVLAVLFVYLFTFLVKKIAVKFNFIDTPEERKFHTKPTPLSGGVALLLGMVITLLLSFFLCQSLIPEQYAKLIFFFIGMILICCLGLLDDFSGMSPFVKFGGQIAIALLFIFGAKMSVVLGPIFISIPVLLLWIVGLMNALNFLDNMDGITSGLAAILGLGFFALGILLGNHFISFISVIFMGSSLGFLFHNFYPAKIFLGDAGSMLIGYILASLGIVLLSELPNNFSRLLPILLLSYAIFDISLVSITRRRDGRNVMQGGKDHSTHRIGTAMGSVAITAVMVYLINIMIVLVTVIVFKAKNQYLTIIMTLLFAMVFLFFGGKLDSIPIVISQNQLQKKTKNKASP